MKYKVGDKVRVKKDLKRNTSYGDYGINDSMLNLVGKIVTIEVVYSDSYKIAEDDCNWFWTDEMLEENIKPTKKELFDMPIGTKIKVENNDGNFNIFIKLEDGYFINIDCFVEILDKSDVKKDLSIDYWGYNKIIEVQEPTYSTVYIENEDDKKEMTIAEIEEKLGYPIKIVKEKTNE